MCKGNQCCIADIHPCSGCFRHFTCLTAPDLEQCPDIRCREDIVIHLMGFSICFHYAGDDCEHSLEMCRDVCAVSHCIFIYQVYWLCL